ncbi:hypothetical protein [Glycomyces sp. NRRL B-16210]|uniref:hypothetical protein n=1 Tax=Glycomyces sp. NRRL B-16210 TaxID=1463821 RepID=UPI0004BEE21E|nr:hypothetical protein [Glycomyces sp. NRRL B-16210]
MFGEEAIAQQLSDARAALRDAVESPEANQVEPVTVEGADGLLRVTVGPEGRIDELEADPSIMRSGSQFVFEEVKRVVNAALDERAQAMGGDEPPPDLEAINESMAEIQDRSLRQFQAMSASISDVMSKLHGSR